MVTMKIDLLNLLISLLSSLTISLLTVVITHHYQKIRDKELWTQEILKIKVEMKNDLLKDNILKSRNEILPDIWGKLNDVIGRINYLINPYKTYPDFNKMENEEIQDYLSKVDFPEPKIKKLLQVRDKNEYYLNEMKFVDLNETEKSYNLFHNNCIQMRIYIDDELSQYLKEIDAKINEIINSMKIQYQSKNVIPEIFQSVRHEFRDNVNELYLKIKDLIHLRMHY